MRDLAQRSGVSTALLSQLERGVANPTVEVLSGIGLSLGLSFTDLSRTPLYEPQVVHRLAAGEDVLQNTRTLLSSTERRRFEVYESVFPSGHVHESAPHGRASEEFAYVITGSLTLEVATWTVQLRSGEAARFSAEGEHSYRTGSRTTRLITIVSMPTE